MEFLKEAIMQVEAVRTRKIKSKDLLKDFLSAGLFDGLQSFFDKGRVFFIFDDKHTCHIYKYTPKLTKHINSFSMSPEEFKQMIFEKKKYVDDVFHYKFLLESYVEASKLE